MYDRALMSEGETLIASRNSENWEVIVRHAECVLYKEEEYEIPNVTIISKFNDMTVANRRTFLQY